MTGTLGGETSADNTLWKGAWRLLVFKKGGTAALSVQGSNTVVVRINAGPTTSSHLRADGARQVGSSVRVFRINSVNVHVKKPGEPALTLIYSKSISLAGSPGRRNKFVSRSCIPYTTHFMLHSSLLFPAQEWSVRQIEAQQQSSFKK